MVRANDGKSRRHKRRREKRKRREREREREGEETRGGRERVTLDDVSETALENYFTTSKDRLPPPMRGFNDPAGSSEEGEEREMTSHEMGAILDASGNRVYSKTQERKLKKAEQAKKRALKVRAFFGDR